MTLTHGLRLGLAAMAIALSPAADAGAAAAGKANIVLVHGALIDGSGWQGVHDILTKDGYPVSVVQQPLTGFADDLAATQRVMDRLEGPIVLVGHSYGGTLITVLGADPKVKALVYIAALQPDVGESSNKLAAAIPGGGQGGDDFVSRNEAYQITKDGFVFLDRAKFPALVAADLPEAQARYMADAQVPIAVAALNAKVEVAAWHDKPSYGIYGTDDQALNPKLAQWMYQRSGAKTTAIKGASHLVFISHPEEVARIIEEAAGGD